MQERGANTSKHTDGPKEPKYTAKEDLELRRQHEQDLFRMYQFYPAEYLEILIEEFKVIIDQVINKKFRVRDSFVLEEMYEEGMIELIRSIQNFKPEKGYMFSTYAGKNIYFYLLNCINDTWLDHIRIRIPRNLLDKLKKVQKSVEAEITPFGIDAMQLSDDEKNRLKDALYASKITVISGQNRIHPSRVVTFEERLPDKVGDGAYLKLELAEALKELLSSLSELDQQVLSLYYGIENGTEHNLSQISKLLGISTKRVKESQTKSIEQLRQLMINHPEFTDSLA